MAELRTTLTLSWRIVLTNVAQNTLTTSDVMMMGWFGPTGWPPAPSARALFRLPDLRDRPDDCDLSMIASELGRNAIPSATCARLVRQGLWTAVAMTLPIWVILWHGKRSCSPSARSPRLAAETAGHHPRALQWGSSAVPRLPGPALVRCRPRRPLGLGDRPPAPPRQRRRRLVPDARPFGLPQLGLAGAGIATALSTPSCSWASSSSSASIANAAVPSVRPVLARRLGALPALWRIGLPIGLTLAFEVTVSMRPRSSWAASAGRSSPLMRSRCRSHRSASGADGASARP